MLPHMHMFTGGARLFLFERVVDSLRQRARYPDALMRTGRRYSQRAIGTKPFGGADWFSSTRVKDVSFTVPAEA